MAGGLVRPWSVGCCSRRGRARPRAGSVDKPRRGLSWITGLTSRLFVLANGDPSRCASGYRLAMVRHRAGASSSAPTIAPDMRPSTASRPATCLSMRRHPAPPIPSAPAPQERVRRLAHTCVECTPTNHPTCMDLVRRCAAPRMSASVASRTPIATFRICLTSSKTCAAHDRSCTSRPMARRPRPAATRCKCTARPAVTIADAGPHVIQIDAGRYTMTATIALGFEGLHLCRARARAK